MQPATKQHAAIELAREWLTRDEDLCLGTAGQSMGALLRAGDRIRIRRARPEELVPGQLIVFRTASGLTTHRLLKTWKRGGGLLLQTKGDTCLHPDPPLPAARVLGRVVAIRRGTRELCMQSAGIRLATGCQLRHGRLVCRIGPIASHGKRLLPSRCSRAARRILLLPVLVFGRMVHYSWPDWRSRSSL